MYDVMIIGSGVSGSAAARELSRYKQKSVYWKKKKMSAVERQKPIVELCTQDMMQKRVH